MIQAKYVRDRQTPKGRPIGYADDTGQVKSAATLYRAGVTSVETSTRCARIAASSGAYSQRAGKSLFARDCVVGLGGLELATKRLSAANSGSSHGDHHRQRLCSSARLLRRKAEHLVLAGPLRRQIGEASNTHAVGEPAIDGRFD